MNRIAPRQRLLEAGSAEEDGQEWELRRAARGEAGEPSAAEGDREALAAAPAPSLAASLVAANRSGPGGAGAGAINQGGPGLDPPPASAADRLVRLAYRLGVPGSALARPFRKPAPPRLLATVASPLAGDRAAGTALRAGHVLVHGVKLPLAQMDFASSAKLTGPVERTVHGFAWLRDLAASGPPAQVASVAEQLLIDWLEANPHPDKGRAWNIGHTGHRLLAWLVHAPLTLSAGDKALRAEILDAVEETARWLDRHAAKADDRLDELAGWCAVAAAGLLLSDGKPRLLHGEAGLAHVLGELVGQDGGVLSRSPLAQIEAIELLVELGACYRAAGREVPRLIDEMLHLLVPPLLAVIHADGALGSWQGAGAVSPARLDALIEASGVRVRPLADARQWGYQRAAAGRSVLQFDAAPPPLARHARHGCASTLAFELSHGEQRLVVNCGGAAFAGGLVPARLEQGLRASAAHSTLVLGDANSTAVLVRGKLGAGVGEVEVERGSVAVGGDARGAAGTRIAASHDGYAARFGLVHRRTLVLHGDGLRLEGVDRLEAAGRKGRRGKVPFTIRFHLGAGVEAVLAGDGASAILQLPDGGRWRFAVAVDGAHEDAVDGAGTGGPKAGEAVLEVDESLWVDGDGRPHPASQIVLQGMVSRAGGSFSWTLEKLERPV